MQKKKKRKRGKWEGYGERKTVILFFSQLLARLEGGEKEKGRKRERERENKRRVARQKQRAHYVRCSARLSLLNLLLFRSFF